PGAKPSTRPARRMSARSVARLTDTLSTPSIRARAASTRPTQLAQVMPSMGRLMDEAARTSIVFDVLMVRSHWLYSTWRQASVLSLKFVQELARLLRSEEHTSELQSRENLVCRLLREKKKKHDKNDS